MLKLQKCWTYLFHSVMKWNQNAIILNQTKTYVFSVKICWLSYLRITLTELWAVVVALYGFCQGGENKRYVLSIAPTTIHTWYTISILKTVKGHANGTIYHVGLKHSFYGTIEWQHFFSPEPACLSFSLSQRCYSALLWWEKMLDWVLIFHIDQITCIENISFCDEYFKQLSMIIESQESFSSSQLGWTRGRSKTEKIEIWIDWIFL